MNILVRCLACALGIGTYIIFPSNEAYAVQGASHPHSPHFASFPHAPHFASFPHAHHFASYPSHHAGPHMLVPPPLPDTPFAGARQRYGVLEFAVTKDHNIGTLFGEEK